MDAIGPSRATPSASITRYFIPTILPPKRQGPHGFPQAVVHRQDTDAQGDAVSLRSSRSVEQRHLCLQDPGGGSRWLLDVVVRPDLNADLLRADLEHLPDVRSDRNDPTLAARRVPVVRDRRRRLKIPVVRKGVADLHLDLRQADVGTILRAGEGP